jgi:hypothetical protein
MASVPNVINGVTVEFKEAVNNSCEPSIVAALQLCVRPDIAPGFTLNRVFISSMKDGQHSGQSRHFQGLGKAVDISRINGKKMAEHFPGDPEVKAITSAIQTAFETFPQKRENFGPFMKKKEGNNHTVGGHHDHVHLSVD